MWSVDEEACTTTETVIACSLSIRGQDLRKRVAGSITEMETNSTTLRTRSAASSLHTISSTDVPITRLNDQELKDLYTKVLARRGTRARPIYDRILTNAWHGLCSYCRHGAADTLDHFVPKSEVPELAIEPYNLVPCCSRCNHKMLASFSTDPAMEMLHPYVAVQIGRWLKAEVDAGNGIVRFYADPPASLPLLLRKRVMNQFRALELGQLFTLLSGAELSGVARILDSSFGSAPVAEVAAHLRGISDQAFATDSNDRRAVLYEALADSDWYCAGGYAEIAA